MNHTLKNHTNQEILTELEKRLTANSLTRNEITTLCSIISEHLYLFYRTFQNSIKQEEIKKEELTRKIRDCEEKLSTNEQKIAVLDEKIEDHYNNLSEEEQEKVDQFWKKYGFKKNDK